MNHVFLKPKGAYIPNQRWSSVCKELGWYCKQLEPSSRAMFATTELQVISKKWNDSLSLIPEFWAVRVVRRLPFHFSCLFRAVANSIWWLVKRQGTPDGFTVAGSESSTARTGHQLRWKFKRKEKEYPGVNNECYSD